MWFVTFYASLSKENGVKKNILSKKDLQCIYQSVNKKVFCDKMMISVCKTQLECNESKY